MVSLANLLIVVQLASFQTDDHDTFTGAAATSKSGIESHIQESVFGGNMSKCRYRSKGINSKSLIIRAFIAGHSDKRSYNQRDKCSCNQCDKRSYNQRLRVYSYRTIPAISNIFVKNCVDMTMNYSLCFFFNYELAVHSLVPQVGLDGQKRSQSGLCSKLPDMRSVGDIEFNPSLRKM